MQTENSNIPLVSIIMPAYNAELYIEQAVQSVLNQTYENVELLIINDGSTDLTEKLILKFNDPRIKYFRQENSGVSIARNTGLARMTGDFFCFLDADDMLPVNSVLDRMKVFQKQPEVEFVDGMVLKMTGDMREVITEWKPQFSGNPLQDLIHLSGNSFANATWMIRRKKKKAYNFRKGLSHGEDLFFFMELAREGGNYMSVDSPVLFYRDTVGSAMKNLQGLERGYRDIEGEIKKWTDISEKDLFTYRIRWRKFIAMDYLKRGQLKKLIGLFS